MMASRAPSRFDSSVAAHSLDYWRGGHVVEARGIFTNYPATYGQRVELRYTSNDCPARTRPLKPSDTASGSGVG
jgi:hypothetical protein